MTSPVSHPGNGPRRAAILRTVLRIAVIAVLAYGGHLAIGWMEAWVEAHDSPGAHLMISAMLVAILLLYTLLMAMPFVPGIEIGVALMMMQGPPIAPFVYVATVLGLTVAFCLGQWVPYPVLQRYVSDLGLVRIGQMVSDIAPLTRQQRADRLAQRLPRWLARPLVGWRYVLVAALLNVPGNAVIGGGGGLMLLAGLTRLFQTGWIVLTIVVAVAPVPIAVWMGWLSLH